MAAVQDRLCSYRDSMMREAPITRVLLLAALTLGLALAGTTAALAAGRDNGGGIPTTPTATTDTTTTATTTTMTTTTAVSTLPAGAVVPQVSLSAPKPGRLVARTPRSVSERLDGKPVATYSIKAWHPVTWWYSVADPNGNFIYGISVFKGATGAHQVASDGTLWVYHQKLVQKRWTWTKPTRGTYQVCATALDSGPVRGGSLI